MTLRGGRKQTLSSLHSKPPSPSRTSAAQLLLGGQTVCIQKHEQTWPEPKTLSTEETCFIHFSLCFCKPTPNYLPPITYPQLTTPNYLLCEFPQDVCVLDSNVVKFSERLMTKSETMNYEILIISELVKLWRTKLQCFKEKGKQCLPTEDIPSDTHQSHKYRIMVKEDHEIYILLRIEMYVWLMEINCFTSEPRVMSNDWLIFKQHRMWFVICTVA